MGKPVTIHSATEKISIDSFKRDFDTLKESCFSEVELQELEQRPLQTKAGIYAVKKALASLYRTLFKAELITEKDFIILHKKNGAPRLKKAPKIPKRFTGYAKKDIHVSLSHNREHAYGLAVIQEKANE